MTQKPRKGDFRKLKSKKFHYGASPGPLLEACALDARLQNRSVFILDPHEYSPLALYGERVQAFAATTSGIVWMDKRCL